MCMFRVRADPDPQLIQDVDGLTVKVQAECCVCKQNVILQKSGAPQSVQTMNRMRVDEVALAQVILQSNGAQPFEVMQLRPITGEEQLHQQLHKFEASQYEKFATHSDTMDLTNTPSKRVHDLFSTPRQPKRLKIQHTLEIEDRMCKSPHSVIQ